MVAIRATLIGSKLPCSTTTWRRPTPIWPPSASWTCSAPCPSSCRCGSTATGGFRCAEEEAIFKADVEERAARYGLMALRWPAELPADTDWAMLVATYAKQTGRVVAYSMAAFRQAFAAGRDLGDRDWVLIAAAAAEMHPTAVIKATELRSMRRRLDEATAAAAAAGVVDVPAVRIGATVFHGDRELEHAAAALAALA